MQMMNHLTGKEYEADVDLQRDEDGGPLGGDSTDEGEVEVEDDVLTDEERTFLKQFPSLKKDAEEGIRKLYAIADSIDKSHQKATKTKVVSNSASAVSGIMSLLGLALAPVTAGGSLILTTAGAGLGVVAGVTNIVTDVKENSRNKRALAEANRVMPTSDQELEEVRGKKMAYVTTTGAVVSKCGTAWETINNHIRALRLTKTHPHVTSAAKKLMSGGQVSTQTSRQVQKAFGGTALAMSKKALMSNGLLAAFFLARDIHSLYEDWKELEARTPTELAKELRERAEVLDRVLSEQTRLYKSLKKKLRDSQKRPAGSSLETAMETQPPPLSCTEKARPRGQWHRGAEIMGL
ncbi:apolipoprotein L6-like [Peromyscus californicus insignis]|uniref:apolipoprotein L6-like n=1 Tax=Peromyscus californicus insignis TaxID=564181 RepID=UPI0022A74B8E|nr:apolipoprotein L6-like [Peromyscus californicus insignis]XP_052604166.1 apolipoprotein L6-like [Peromyscus californicus insignis]XP_052604167.1 apolipoprotein L6-like [Peromyscus californicus insignis]XP_052604168.1 apolipoprotein L6-like [Peromyscus californicus insignis]XP_052604169.1 apolipoprotein L6-like [Peromyscus californicus insignis]XP_052604170.1 apolipoprotein L6-like [Peromyscus californicus insignis]